MTIFCCLYKDIDCFFLKIEFFIGEFFTILFQKQNTIFRDFLYNKKAH